MYKILPKIFLLVIFQCMFTIQLSAQESPANQILISNVNVFDGKSDNLAMGQDVLVENNLIKQVGRNLKASEGALRIDGGGRTLTPGFIDAHTHIALIAPFDQLENEYTGVYIGAAGGQMAENMLMRGFTTVRDPG